MSIIKNKLWFESNLKWEINNGENISFWYGRWNDKSPLAISYPRLYALHNSKTEAVNEVWLPNSNDWNIKPRRLLNDREIILWDNVKSFLPIHNSLQGTNSPI